jgi:hypothetical protein
MAQYTPARRVPSAPAPQTFTPARRVTPAAPAENGGSDWTVPALAAAGLGAGAYALSRNPAIAKKALGGFLDLRRMSMLSGLAPLKSALGNVGASAYGSIERGSLAPLKEMFSPATAREAYQTFKTGPTYTGSGPASGLSKWNLPGRVMGSMDTAAQGALVRAGYTPKQAAVEMLQGPQYGPITKALQDNPIADYLVPFRRTPFNQLSEGFNSMKPSNLGTKGQKVALGTSIASGAATGAMAEDPKTIALGTAFSGRRGLPFALSAGISRALTSGSKNKGLDVISGMSPVSDYSLGEGAIGPVMDPSRIIPTPAAVPAYSYLRKLFGMD